MDLSILKLNQNLTYSPSRIISIIGSSRSGSTVFKHALCLHPELCCLAGEEEPYYKLTENGYPWHSSDEFHTPDHPQEIVMLIANELHNHSSVENRKALQSFNVEEPPYVDPIECRITDTLVLKTPQNCYRRGVLDVLYPEAEKVYISVSRNRCAVVNGLLDGWLSKNFTARMTPHGWWKFDMPPDWTWNQFLIERCIHQWRSAIDFISLDYSDVLVNVQFEDFEKDWIGVCKSVWRLLSLSPFDPSASSLPVLSATDPPEKNRWKRKRPWLEEAIEGINLW